MKIYLPDGKKHTLDNNITLEEKMIEVERLTKVWEDVINENWNSKSVRYFLDGLSNYIVWHKEEEDKNKHEKEIFSIKRVEQMEGKRKSPTIPFSSLSKEHGNLLGIDGGE